MLLILRFGRMMTVGFEKVMLLYNPSIYETADVINTFVYRKGLLGYGLQFRLRGRSLQFRDRLSACWSV